ncbi:MAG: hypothetical protein LBF65_01560 [Holosporales bacterium]|jgi:type IV secretory pathway VirB10-like protein|nr:hypothetical protein [Holosporales bacterium]
MEVLGNLEETRVMKRIGVVAVLLAITGVSYAGEDSKEESSKEGVEAIAEVPGKDAEAGKEEELKAEDAAEKVEEVHVPGSVEPVPDAAEEAPVPADEDGVVEPVKEEEANADGEVKKEEEKVAGEGDGEKDPDSKE